MHISIFENLQLEGLYVGDLLYLGLLLWAVRRDSCVYSVPLTHLHDRAWGVLYPFLGQGAMKGEGESFDLLVSDSLCLLTLLFPF